MSDGSPTVDIEGKRRDRAQAFFIEEFKALREEIKIRIEEIAALERYFLVATAAFYVWLAASQFGIGSSKGEALSFSNEQKQVLRILWFIPSALALLGGIRAAGSGMRLSQIGKYIKLVEDKWRRQDLDQDLQDSGLKYQKSENVKLFWGWEGYMPQHRTGISISSLIFWPASIIITFVIALQAPK